MNFSFANFAPNAAFEFFFSKKINHSNLVFRGYVVRTNQIAALGYVSYTCHITIFGCLEPIIAFGYCFLVNDVLDQGLCRKNDISQKIWVFARASSTKVDIYRDMKVRI